MKWNMPGPDMPGYLRRRRELAELLAAPSTPENISALTKHLAQYVEGDEKQAIADIEELSGKEWADVVLRLQTGVAVDPPKGESSATP